MAIDLKNLSPKQLQELIANAEQQKRKLQRERRDEVRKKLIQIAKDEGYTIDDLFGGGRSKGGGGAGRKVSPKYQNPNNPGQVWSGRGKRPRWFTEALASGRKESDLLV